mmetsp:Transcript_25958/g.39777  ORF Transcript_25958/g.39777 Transcript_25958/m.39777 type:complete len:85 (-) Transcript_25958:25-279(-)
MMTGGKWKPVNSNSLLMATCSQEEYFKGAYAASSKGGQEQSVYHSKDVGVMLGKNLREVAPNVFFIQLSESRRASFKGQTQCFN